MALLTELAPSPVCPILNGRRSFWARHTAPPFGLQLAMKPNQSLLRKAQSGLRAVIFALSLVVTLPQRSIGADESLDGPKRIFKDEFIENLVGDWKLTRTIRGTEVENTVHVEWVLNHQFLQVHMKDVGTPPAYEAIVLIGYAYADQKYVAHWCDTYGGKFSAIGHGKRSGDSIEFEFHYPDGPFYNTFNWDPKTKSWTFRMENQNKEGKRALFAVHTLRRP
jgi:hypothetical protein